MKSWLRFMDLSEKGHALREALIRAFPLFIRARGPSVSSIMTAVLSRYVITKFLASPVRAVTGLVPITTTHEDDVFLVGYAKSGNTWLQNLVAGVVYGVDPEYAPDALIQWLVPDVLAKDFYRRFVTPMFFKSHELPNPRYRRVVYLLRDGRDVMVSLYHFWKAQRGKYPDFLWLVKFRQSMSVKWHQHVEAWLSNPYKADMIVIRYEELKRDPVEQMRKFCSFARIDRPDSVIQAVTQKASFEKMREKEIRYGMDLFPPFHGGSLFMRRGEVGNHRNEMPKHVLEVFLKEAGETLRRCGYL